MIKQDLQYLDQVAYLNVLQQVSDAATQSFRSPACLFDLQATS